ncbi:O-mycaminosyltylonolide 6-deoxyallosyltransferase [Acaryochloris thomasi RCC1774]|uniref:O-mycaminosyltylonolide 6-deoxyallosyltransferase n=1 Tax=Acaryochloris thomasi RCC1774 TaxID=1764569 RepID=A0A2W1JGX5_9CYAN|nr:glycosyltransferase [Acaryochloris thomasi]PZD72636.1 O-mycaminosyltylonolide 6-deoxyallosyltransferase [Acaryochloris thomasi RCC1774]
MKVTILATGTRGDVQPYVALGLGLKAAGHQVRVASSKTFSEFVGAHALEFHPLEVDVKQVLGSEVGADIMKKGSNPVQFIRLYGKLMRPFIEQQLHDSWQACQGADALIYSPLSFGGASFGEKLQIPHFLAKIQPVGITREFPSPVIPPGIKLGGMYNLLTYKVVKQISRQTLTPPVKDWLQANLQISPARSWRQLQYQKAQLFGFSDAVVPKPHDWPDSWYVTGYWVLEQSNWQPPAELIEFLAAGPPPVYIGFGSMKSQSPAALTQLAIKALSLSNQRGILLTGWGSLRQTDLPKDVYIVDSVSHDWLFPQMAAVVHHGGSGTTAASLRAGVPTIITPFVADQPFWGDRIQKLGIGPAPIRQNKLTADALSKSISAAINHQPFKERAVRLSQRIKAENGVAQAVDIFNQLIKD